MKIGTFNVEFLFEEGEQRHSGKTWTYTKEYVASRIEHLAKRFLEIDADVLFLQEVASEGVLKRIIERTGTDYSHFLAKPDKFGVRNAVIYKSKDCVCESIPAVTDFPVIVEGDVDTIGPQLRSRRDFVHLTTLYHGKPLHLFGLHLNSRFFVKLFNKDRTQQLPINTQIEAGDGLIRSEMIRCVQARKMRQVMDTLFATNACAQIAVMGDFNSIIRDTPLRIIQGEFMTATDALVFPVSYVPVEKRYSFIGDYGSKLIDYILISKPLESHVKSLKILNETLTQHSNQTPKPTFAESDHAPIVIELE